jgi:hypothetical protein
MSSLERLLLVIINKFLLKTYCLSIFSDSPINLQINIPVMSFNTIQLAENILKSFELGCSDFIISIENPKEFLEKFDRTIRRTSQRRGNRKLIFASTRENRGNLIDVLKMNESKYIPDILLILPKNCDTNNNCWSYELGTNKFAGKDGHQDLIILDEWNYSNSSFVRDLNLFPDKLLDLKGKTIRIATFFCKPYILFDIDGDNRVTNLDGTDIRIVSELCR